MDTFIPFRPMNAFEESMAVIRQFTERKLPKHIDTPTLEKHIERIQGDLGELYAWGKRLKFARQMLGERKMNEMSEARIRAELEAQATRIARKHRYLGNRAARAEANREMATQGGSSNKKKR